MRALWTRAQVSAVLLRGAGVSLDEEAVAAALALLEPFRDDAADAARAAHVALESAASTDRATIEKLEPVELVATDFGLAHEWHALHDNCYTTRHGGFEYRLCPFDSFTQDGRSLGKYEGWSPRAADNGEKHVHTMEMAFGQGEVCGDSPRRARVAFECGEEDELLAVSEPSTCEYAATFSSPSACTVETVRQLHDELAAAAAAAGLPYEPHEVVQEALGLR